MFLLAPIEQYANTPVFIPLLFMPLVGMAHNAFPACMAVLSALALFLVFQYFFAPELMYHGVRASWPLLNPNSAGTLMAVGLVSSLAFWPLMPVFAAALLCTGSKGALIAALVSLGVYVASTRPGGVRYALPAAGVLGAVVLLWDYTRDSLFQRFPIWEAAAPMINAGGTGIGTFYKLYPGIKLEEETAGYFVHNDMIQFAIEMGWPAALIFIGVAIYTALKTTRRNIIPACAMLAVFIHSMVSFPLYVPSICIVMGALFSWWLSWEAEEDPMRSEGILK